jgi:hypothetical protein
VSNVDPGVARNTVDVNLMVNRSDLTEVTTALSNAGFVYYYLFGVAMFLDGPDGRPRDAVHLLLAGEKVKAVYAEPAPHIDTVSDHDAYKLLALEPLVTMKLTSFRRKDQVRLLHLIEVVLVDSEWLTRLQPELALRLKE